MGKNKKFSLNPKEMLETASAKAMDLADKAIDTASKVKNIDPADIPGAAAGTVKNAAGFAQDTAGKAVDAAGTALTKSQQAVINAIDENGNGEIDIEDIIIKGLKTPGIKINRTEFLRKEFFKNHPKEVIDDIIRYNPVHAHISREEIDKIADEVIKYERNCVSGISTALGMPGGVAMAATIPADIIQYYGYMLRATQKLLYLYGFPEIDTSEKGQKFDSETINVLTICMGVMYGVAGANNALKAMAKALAIGVEKKLLRAALTKGSIYPIVKSVASWFGKRMTKQIFTGFFKNSIPVVGGVIGGGITFLSFKPCCDQLKHSLQDTMLSNPDHVSGKEEDIIVDVNHDEVIIVDED